MEHLRPRRLLAGLTNKQRDALLGLGGALLAVACLLVEAAEWGAWVRAPDLLGIGLILASGGALALYRLRPLTGGLLSSAAYTLAAFLGYSVFLSGLISFFIVGACAAHASRRATLVLGSAVVAMAVALSLHEEGGVIATEIVSSIALAAVPVAIGDAFRVRRELAAEAEARAARLEQLRDLELARAIDEERLRIARDVHDTVGHHLSAIAIQAGVGEKLVEDGDEEAVAQSLSSIRGLTTKALSETRRLLRLVRTEAERRAPGLTGVAEIEVLAAQLEQGGLSVSVRLKGDERPLDGVVGDCAYRIVQEALTNISRHAEATHAVVEVSYGPTSLELVIEDDGVGGASNDGGHGLIGMRERVAVAHGELSVGPQPDRGWRVRALLPYEALAAR